MSAAIALFHGNVLLSAIVPSAAAAKPRAIGDLLASATLMSVLGTSDLYALDAADLSWSAEYEEAGLVIREEGGAAAATPLGDTDRALLREVKVQEKQP